MKKEDVLVFMLSCLVPLLGVVVKTYVPEDKSTGTRQYPQVVQFATGEGTLIDSCWILTGGYQGNLLKKQLEDGQSPQVFCNGRTYLVEKVIIPEGFKNSEDGQKTNFALVKIKGEIRDDLPAEVMPDSSKKHF